MTKPMSTLRRRMIEDMQVRNLLPVMQRCYVHAVAKLPALQPVPYRLGLEEVRSYLHPPHHDRHPVGRVRPARRPRPALPLRRHTRPHCDGRAHPLCAQAKAAASHPGECHEIVRFFAAVPSLKHRTALMAAYDLRPYFSPKSCGCGSPISTATAC